MDRFIDVNNNALRYYITYLKSNMDRFIAKSKFGVESVDLSFKIQYG